MKIMIASDIHGSSYYAQKLIGAYSKENCEKLILLGDILYHGPRNDLPEGYDPKDVIALLNSYAGEILAVRGNCEAEVDQMVLDFSVMSDSLLIYDKGTTFFLTHGHLWNEDNLPKIKSGDILIHGHTHVQCVKEVSGITYINPGSVSIPKEGNPQSYMVYDNGIFTIYDFDKNILNTYELRGNSYE